jgi:hypothetical protein
MEICSSFQQRYLPPAVKFSGGRASCQVFGSQDNSNLLFKHVMDFERDLERESELGIFERVAQYLLDATQAI